jgi:calcineurin-like phosphoesterase
MGSTWAWDRHTDLSPTPLTSQDSREDARRRREARASAKAEAERRAALRDFEEKHRALAERTHADDIVIVEAHMEATSEKIALARFLDGRVAAVVGTHTHVPTADARILKGGTAFMTDLGMCGPYDSIIGRSTDAVLRHLTTGLPTQYDVAEGGTLACGAVIEISEDTGLARSIERYELSA